MATWYERLDAALGGVLPGGVALGTPFGSTAAEAAQPGGVSGFPLAQPAAPAAAPASRGRIVTVKQRLVPGMPPEIVSIVPGGVAVYQRDVTATKRLRRVTSKLNRLFPRPRRGKGKK